jgi:hypothetical protein
MLHKTMLLILTLVCASVDAFLAPSVAPSAIKWDQNYFTDRDLELKTYPDHQYI